MFVCIEGVLSSKMGFDQSIDRLPDNTQNKGYKLKFVVGGLMFRLFRISQQKLTKTDVSEGNRPLL